MQPVEIVLVEPEIPPNTGNIGRACVGLGLPLTLAGTLGFEISDRQLRRAGLDYWPKLDVKHEPDAERVRQRLLRGRPVLFSKKGSIEIWDADLRDATALVFGRETRGLPERWLAMDVPKIRFPQSGAVRSYNLSNVVFAAAMEWVRQTGWQPAEPGAPQDSTEPHSSVGAVTSAATDGGRTSL